MTMTLGKLVDATEALGAIVKMLLPSDAAFRLGKLVRLAQPEIDSFHEQRNAAMRRLGKVSEDTPGMFTFDDPERAVFDEEMTTLRAVTMDLSAQPISLKSLHGKDVLALHLMALEDAGLLVDDTETPQA